VPWQRSGRGSRHRFFFRGFLGSDRAPDAGTGEEGSWILRHPGGAGVFGDLLLEGVEEGGETLDRVGMRGRRALVESQPVPPGDRTATDTGLPLGAGCE